MKKFFILLLFFSSQIILSDSLITSHEFSVFRKTFDTLVSEQIKAQTMEEALILKSQNSLKLTFLFKNKYDYQNFLQKRPYKETDKLHSQDNQNNSIILLEQAAENLLKCCCGSEASWTKKNQLKDIQVLEDNIEVKLLIEYNISEQIQTWQTSSNTSSNCLIF